MILVYINIYSELISFHLTNCLEECVLIYKAHHTEFLLDYHDRT